jgi:hypothetical protein
MKQRQWLCLFVFFLFLSACRTAAPPVVGELTPPQGELTTAQIESSPGFWFLPPVAKGATPSDFELNLDASLEIRIFEVKNLEGDWTGVGIPLKSFSTFEGGGISIEKNHYQANWDVSTFQETDVEFVRVEVRFPTEFFGPVCNNGTGGDCLGFFDVHLITNQGLSQTPEGFLRINRSRTLPIKFFIGEGETIFQPVPDTLAGLTPLSLTAEEWLAHINSGENCTANGFNTPGQGFSAVGAGFSAVGAGLSAVGAGFSAVGAGFSAVGAVGGFLVIDLEEVPFPIDTTTIDLMNPGDAGQLVTNIAGLTTSGLNKVAILVVDDFKFGEVEVYELPGKLLNEKFMNEDEVNNLFVGLIENKQLSHGALVLHHMLELVKGAGYEVFNNQLDNAGRYIEFKPVNGNGPMLLVQAVDTEGFNTDQIPNKIKASLERVTSLGYSHAVVNMSFAIVPCVVQKDFAASRPGIGDITDFLDYLIALARSNGINYDVSAEEFDQLVTSPLGTDPLITYLDNPVPFLNNSEILSLVHVASSGNFGNNFQLLPAALPSVIGVGSVNKIAGGFGGPSWFSNDGEVMAPGALQRLNNKGRFAISYAGTSFAAPAVALFTARDLAQFDPRCGGRLVNGSFVAPALAHGEENSFNLPLDTVFANSHVDSAVASFCKLPQAINFGPLADKTFGDAPFTISAIGGDSGNRVTFSATGSCTVEDNFVTTTGVGRCTITAKQAGNNNYAAANPIKQSFNVIYNFSGFFRPVEMGALNRVNAGRAIPVKFSLDGNQGLNIFSPGYPRVVRLNSCTGPIEVIADNQTFTAGNSSLTYDPAVDQYNYVWKTESSWAGTCRQLQVRFIDGTEQVANFHFTR